MLSGSPVTGALRADQLLDRFLATSGRQRRALLRQIEQRHQEILPFVADRLTALDATGDDWAGGFLVQLMLTSGDDAARENLLARYPEGWLAVTSAAGLDYSPLQRHLMFEEFEAADRFTSEVLRRLAGEEAVRRGYVYYSEVTAMPGVDLESLDRLWVCYSRGRYGFSVQARLLAACEGRWERLWPRLGWKQEGVWSRYPTAFDWSQNAPEGHMPLVNQLRGVRLMDALLHHPALQRRVRVATGLSTG